MNIDEMKNKISMALKNPILQQGFEIICKENTELKEENKVLTQNLEDTEIVNKTYEKRFDDLKTENAELEKRCANYEMKISKMEKGTCDVCKETEKDKKIVELATRCNELFLQTCEQAEKIKELNAEIENDRDLPAIAYMQGAEKQKKKDEEELKKWKDEWQEQVQKATDEGYARTLQTIQLTKAKEIIKTFLGFAEAFGYSPSMDRFITEAEQFLSEVEK